MTHAAFGTFQNKQSLDPFLTDQLGLALKNSLKYSKDFLGHGTAKELFQLSLQFLSTCNRFFSQKSSAQMLLLIKVALKWIQNFLGSHSHNPSDHRKKVLFMAQKLSSPSFLAFFKRVGHLQLKFQLLKFTK
jgi:hypothetical protein